MTLLERTPNEVGPVTPEKRKLVVDIVGVSCIALLFVIGASLIEKIAVGTKRTKNC